MYVHNNLDFIFKFYLETVSRNCEGRVYFFIQTQQAGMVSNIVKSRWGRLLILNIRSRWDLTIDGNIVCWNIGFQVPHLLHSVRRSIVHDPSIWCLSISTMESSLFTIFMEKSLVLVGEKSQSVFWIQNKDEKWLGFIWNSTKN